MNKALWVCRKEVREMWRDKRVRSGAIIMPMVLVFAIMGLIGLTVDAVSKPGALQVYVVNARHPVAQQMINSESGIKPVESIEEGKKLIESGKAKLVLAFPESTDQTVQIDAYFDKKEEKSQVILAKMEDAIGKVSKERLKQILAEKGIPPEMVDPVRMVRKPVKVGSDESAAGFLIQMLPYLIVIWAFYGGMGIVGDLFAGEKERQTLETLLISPASRSDITLGKFLALTLVCLTSAMSALVGMLIIGASGIPMVTKLFPHGLGITPLAILATIVVLAPTAALFSGVMLAVSAYAKNLREAQTHLAILSFIILMPAMLSQVIGYLDFAKQIGIYFVPVLNTSAIVRAALQGKMEFLPFLVTVASSLILASVALAIAIRLVKREEVLVRV